MGSWLVVGRERSGAVGVVLVKCLLGNYRCPFKQGPREVFTSEEWDPAGTMMCRKA
jgi:hypothetical protein